ncbi:hypothetical protein AWB70_04334 [Caballeronia cordobensis]|uniref:Uncharacterized protein n=1 Tax=Caballeronia cordobensis TaxID=1353886 RepID=A0A158I709_CABCO|nr:hypothetical protein AWB70_04334 [Caballeronia cordobensis]
MNDRNDERCGVVDVAGGTYFFDRNRCLLLEHIDVLR